MGNIDLEREEEMTDAAIIYRTHFNAIENLPECLRYEALKALICYCLDDEEPEDGIGSCLLMMAKPILDKWKGKREAGKKGGEANGSKPEANAKQTGSEPEPKVKVKVKVKDIKEKDTEKESPAKAEPVMVASKEIISYLNEKIGSRYSASSKSTVTLIKGRLNEGHSVDDFKTVIDIKAAEWKDTDMENYLRPETLFAPSHFESYLNQKPKARSWTGNRFDRNMAKRTGTAKEENDRLVRKLLEQGA